NTLAAQVKSAQATLVDHLQTGVAEDLPAGATPANVYDALGQRLTGLELGEVVVYDAQGAVTYPPPSDKSEYNGNRLDREDFTQALGGATLIDVRSPDDLPDGYAPAQTGSYTM